jgi:hypothetical protein
MSLCLYAFVARAAEVGDAGSLHVPGPIGELGDAGNVLWLSNRMLAVLGVVWRMVNDVLPPAPGESRSIVPNESRY